MRSAGILLYRRNGDAIEVLLAHPGGPFWRNKDEGVWGIPKGLVDPGEDPLTAARREFLEETGFPADGEAHSLGSVKQKSGKLVEAWAIEGDLDPAAIRSNAFTMEWPPRSGKTAEFPEIDRAAWFGLAEARRKILEAQADFLERLAALA